MTRPAAVLFDLDGTLIESEHLYSDIGSDMVHAVGGVWTEADRLAAVGTAIDDFAVTLRRAGIDLPVDEIVTAVVDQVTMRMRSRIPWRAGAIDLLESVANSGIACGLVTMAYRDTVQVLLDDPHLLHFDVVVTGDDVMTGKPNPEPYQLATHLLGVEPADCVAIEDSVPGLTSAGGAGLTRIAVPLDADITPGLYEARWDTLVGHTVADVVATWARSYTESTRSAGTEWSRDKRRSVASSQLRPEKAEPNISTP